MGRRKFSPLIRPDEYDAFGALINDANFPDTFDAWLEHLTQQDEHYTSQGRRIQEIVIHPKEFADWCRECGFNPSMQNLYSFTSAKATRKD